MALKETVVAMSRLITQMQRDIVKAAKGNKTASQRIRTGSILFAKVAKSYRKESVAAEKKQRR